jgi:FAD/FMN-containing dehydrogenase
MSIVLPPEISERSLERAVQAFCEVVGSDHVLTDPDQIREFRDPFWHPAWDEHEASAVVQPASVEEVQAMVRLANEHRAHLDFMDLAADQYSFGDHAYRRFTETIKDAVDPNGILAPGKQGIWPASMRA